MTTQSLNVTETKTDLVDELNLAVDTDYTIQNASSWNVYLAETGLAFNVASGFVIQPSESLVIRVPASGSLFVWVDSGNALVIVGAA